MELMREVIRNGRTRNPDPPQSEGPVATQVEQFERPRQDSHGLEAHTKDDPNCKMDDEMMDTHLLKILF